MSGHKEMNKGVVVLQNTPHGGNYEAKVLAIVAALNLPKGQVAHTHIAHDKHCHVWANGLCTCDPDIRVVAEDGTVLYPKEAAK